MKILSFLLILILSTTAMAQDVPDWWHAAHNPAGISCCGTNDYVPEAAIDIERRDGGYIVHWQGHALPVDPKVIMPSPDYLFHVSIRNQGGHDPWVLCFFEPRSV